MKLNTVYSFKDVNNAPVGFKVILLNGVKLFAIIECAIEQTCYEKKEKSIVGIFFL